VTTRRDIMVRLWFGFVGGIGAVGNCSDEPVESKATPTEIEYTEMSGEPLPQFGVPTLGGMQFWGDVLYFQGYKIQRNVFTGSFRLLDKNNRRYQSGTVEDCRRTLEQFKTSEKLAPDTGHAVIYLHGIGRTSRSMRPILKSMPQDGFVHVAFEYPSTRVPIAQAADYLHSVIESLTEVSKISFVVHSMGGLVVRRYLQEHNEPRIHRMVMLGTPNSGAELADMLKRNMLFRAVYGPAGQELVTDPEGTIGTLPVPQFEFGVIAGGKGDEQGFNPLLPGDDDGTVTVKSARLPGAADFLRVPKLHSFLMSDTAAIAATKCFLEHGRFSMTSEPQPIGKESAVCP
jgi:pimeloyl-ACP methyl ester carboxylesterase